MLEKEEVGLRLGAQICLAVKIPQAQGGRLFASLQHQAMPRW